MSNISLTWSSSKSLPCGEDTEIVIVVPSSKLAQRNCPIQPLAAPETTVKTSFSYDTLDAVLVNVYENFNDCGTTYTYTAEIDSNQVVAGQTIFSTDILGVVCKGAWSKWVKDQVGQDIKVIKSGNQIFIISQHGCIFALDALDANGLVSGVWEEGNLDLPACNIDGGQLIYVDSAGKLRTEPSKNYIVPVRLDAGAYDSGLGNIPANGLQSTPLVLTFKNNECRPVSFNPLVEAPIVLFDAGAANFWRVSMGVTGSNPDDPTWGPALVNPWFGFSFPAAGGNIEFPPGMTTYPGPTIINPGTTISLGLTWVFNSLLANANGNNRVQIFGPRLSYIAHTL